MDFAAHSMNFQASEHGRSTFPGPNFVSFNPVIASNKRNAH